MPADSRVEIVTGIFVEDDPALPASPEILARLEAEVGPLPADYLTFLSRTNGVEGVVEDKDDHGGWLSLLSAEEVLETVVSEPNPFEVDPSFLQIGSNGGLAGYCLDKSSSAWEYVEADYIGDWRLRFASLTDLMTYLKTCSLMASREEFGMDPHRVEIAEGVHVLAWEAPVPAPPEDVQTLLRIWGPLPADYLALLARANGASGEIENAEGDGVHVFLHDVAHVLKGCAPDALGLTAHDDWRRDTVLASNKNLVIGSYLADGLIAIETRPDGRWEYVDILTDFQSEPLIGVETRHPSLAALLHDLKIRGES